MHSGIGAVSGVAGADWILSHRATRREQRMLAEFPTVAELLALAVGAGEGAVGRGASVSSLTLPRLPIHTSDAGLHVGFGAC